MPFSFGVKKWDTEIYFLLNKTVNTTNNEDMDAALASYMKVDSKISYMKFFKDNWLLIVSLLTVVFAVVIIYSISLFFVF